MSKIREILKEHQSYANGREVIGQLLAITGNDWSQTVHVKTIVNCTQHKKL